MPGIMPMKIIKIGSSSQSRVAQACDRCRSKKIRCDGIAPCCTQCAHVGFECKTSDKLSRRAFPRGYTESLEERVRQLETEVRDLKGLLDEKDEKIDLLSKFHDFSPTGRRSNVSGSSQAPNHQANACIEHVSDETFAIKQPVALTKSCSRTEPHWAGASSPTSFLDVFRDKAVACGRAVPPTTPRALFPGKALTARRPAGGHARRPPRLVSDRLVNVFFQEFAPLFPVLYRPAFLQRYRNFSEGADNLEDHHSAAQLNLVFSIAAVACDAGRAHVSAFDNHWQTALNVIVHDNSLATLQCLILAQLCCLCKGENNRMLYYAGVAVIMSRRLGLHKMQAGFSLDILTTEMRGRTFWCLYTLDTFTAAHLGLPRLMKDEVIQTEMPTDMDDEDLLEQRNAAKSGETKLSASLGLFSLAKIFARVIDSVYQASAIEGVSTQSIDRLSDELDNWHRGLAPHLRLTFAQDKPSTLVTGDRSPLLSLAYYHVKALLHRPLATSDLGSKAVPSILILAESSKRIVQILQLLDERHMSLALPLSRSDTLATAGLGILYQGLSLSGQASDDSPPVSSSIMHENQRLICMVIGLLEAAKARCTNDFRALASSLIAIDGLHARRSPPGSQKQSISPRSSISQASGSHSSSDNLVASGSSSGTSPAAPSRLSAESATSPRKIKGARRITIAQRRALASPDKIQFPIPKSMMLPQQQQQQQRYHHHNPQQGNHIAKEGLTPTRSEPSLRAVAAAHDMFAAQQHQPQVVEQKRTSVMFPTTENLANLNYLPLGNVSPVQSLTPMAQAANMFESASGVQWDQIIGTLNATSILGDLSGCGTPSTDMLSPGHSGMDCSGGGNATSITPGCFGQLDWSGTGAIEVGSHPMSASATAWTSSTGVPSVFDDSGASFTSGDDRRSSIDLGGGCGGQAKPADLRESLEYLTDNATSANNHSASGSHSSAPRNCFELEADLADDFPGLQGLEVGLRI